MDIDRSRLRRDRALYYSGLFLFLAGMPGLMLSSWLHDLIRVPIIGEVYDAWGWLNQMAFLMGIFISVIGGAMLAVSLRGGAIDPKQIATHVGES